MSNTEDNKGIIGRRVLTITPDLITGITEYNEKKNKWSSVYRIAEDDNYIYIYIEYMKNYVIPKKAFENDAAITSFVETAKQYKAQSSS